MENETKLLLAKANDLVRLRDLRNIPKFSAFLTPSEAAVIEKGITAPNCCFFGGYPEAERQIFAAMPEYIDNPLIEFPIRALKFEYRKADVLSHRDFLGSFMATGITRDSIGDICIGEGYTTAFVTNDIAPYLLEQISKIGRVGVSAQLLSISNASDLFPPPKTISFNFTVSSIRLDAVLSGLVGCSRSRADSYIKEGLVFINSFEVTKSTRQIKIGDRITLRGTGKFLIADCKGVSKKGREIIVAEKYI